MKTLNRIQSKVCGTALFSGENMLVCAPTGELPFFLSCCAVGGGGWKVVCLDLPSWALLGGKLMDACCMLCPARAPPFPHLAPRPPLR